MDPPRLTLFSTPLVSTWVLDETHRILFDAGDGVTAMLEGKIHKANIVALTHAHRDHIDGLPQLLNLRGGVAAANGEPLRIVHPEGCVSLYAYQRFLSQLDPTTAGRTRWEPLEAQNRISIDDTHFLHTFATRHIPGPDHGRSRSLGYQVGRTVERLKPELRGAPQSDIDTLRRAGGREAIITTEEEILLTVSGDTLVMSADTVRGTPFLLHECTFLDTDEIRTTEARERGHEHSCLGEVLAMAQSAGVLQLGLYHVSKRYSDEEILRTLRAECAKRDIKFKVSVALPGRVYADLFSQTVWPQK